MNLNRLRQYFQHIWSKDENIQDSILKLRMYQTREAFSLMGMGALVGVLAGLAGVSLNLAVNWLESLRDFLPIWILVVFPTFGAILGIYIQHNIFRDSSGHGVPDVIQSVTIGRGLLSVRMLFSRLISSALTVGSGGSAGLEGPIVVSGAAAGSLVARLFALTEVRRTLLIACGTSGAIGGIFNAPLTGLIFSLEVILGEWRAKNLVPTVTSAAVATHVSRELIGDKIPFPREAILHGSYDLLAFGMLGIMCAIFGTFLMRSLEFGTLTFQKVKVPVSLRAGIGALGVGLIAMVVPQVMGEGYELILGYILNDPAVPLMFVFGLIFLRILTTTLTLGSGGAGGIFAPSLYLGSSIGLLFGSFLKTFFSSWFAQPGAYALGGMAGVVTAVMVAPLTGIFLVLEICGSYDLILPLMICVLTSFLCSRLLNTGSIYTRDLITSGIFKPRGSQELILAEAAWDELISTTPYLDESLTLDEFHQLEWPDRQTIFAVKGDDQFRGCFDLAEVQGYLKDANMLHLVTLSQVINETGFLTTEQTPDECLVFFGEMNVNFVPILNGDEYLGVVTKETVFDFIRRETLILEDQ